MIKKILQKIFKKISYFLFFKIYGKIEHSIKTDNDRRIQVESVNIDKDFTYKVYKITSGRLYTDRIHDTAVMLENKIIEGPSFQLRYKNYSYNNSPISNNIVFAKGTPRRLKSLNGITVSLLTGGAGNNNYWHWLHDVLPRFKLCEKIRKLEQIDYFILPSLKKNFQNETLKELNISEQKILSSEKFRHVKTKELIVTDHPYVLSDDSHKDAQNIPKWISKWLKEKFLLNSKPSKKNYPKNIFVDRTDPTSNSSTVRSLINESEIRKFLKQKNFTFVRLHELSFVDQVHYFNNAEYIIGLHGGGFANLSFCRNETKVIEFRMEKAGPIIENLAKNNNLKFDSIIIRLENTDYDRQSGHLKVPLNILEEKMDNVKN